MYHIVKTVISAGDYKLSEIRHKVQRLYMMDAITEAQMDELLRLAAAGVSADAERPETFILIRTLADKLEELAERVAALEGGTTEPETYPEWKAWDGISKDYQMGAIVSHNGDLWESVFDGQNVWQPGQVDETFWKILK